MTTSTAMLTTTAYPRAKEVHSDNPTVEQHRITDLLKCTADDLFGKGTRPHTRFLVHLAPAKNAPRGTTLSTGEAA